MGVFISSPPRNPPYKCEPTQTFKWSFIYNGSLTEVVPTGKKWFIYKLFYSTTATTGTGCGLYLGSTQVIFGGQLVNPTMDESIKEMTFQPALELEAGEQFIISA